MPTTNRPFWRSRWWMPGFSVFLGLLILGAAWIGDNRGEGVFGLAVMVALALVFVVFGRRSDTLAGLGGPGRDERWQAIDVHATALAGSVLVAIIIGAWLVELAKGEDGEPYSQLGAAGGIAYILAVAFLRWRS
jgi:hypothetical protein